MAIKDGKFLQECRKLAQNMRAMGPKQKIVHLWMCYHEYFLIGLVVLLVLTAFFSGVLRKEKEVVVSGLVANTAISQTGYNYLTQDYAEILGIDEKEQTVQLTYANFEDLENPAYLDATHTAYMQLVAMTEAQMVDYVLLDELALELYINQDLFMDLRDFFTPEEMENWRSDVIYLEYEGQQMFPVAIDITNLPFVKDAVHGEDPVYLAFVANTPRQDACRNLWQYIQSWESK